MRHRGHRPSAPCRGTRWRTQDALRLQTALCSHICHQTSGWSAVQAELVKDAVSLCSCHVTKLSADVVEVSGGLFTNNPEHNNTPAMRVCDWGAGAMILMEVIESPVPDSGCRVLRWPFSVVGCRSCQPA